MRVDKRPFVFYKEIQKFAVAPKQPFVFCREIQILHLYLNNHSIFYSEMQNFENCNQTAIHDFTTKYRILKVVPKRPFVFPT